MYMKVLLISLLACLLARPLMAASFETSLNADNLERLKTLLLFNSSLVDVGITTDWVKTKGLKGIMGGMNIKGFSIGHLHDAGLASEIRNPQATALARLSERTFFRANPRSHSQSRIGLSVSVLADRIGLALERRKKVETLLMWAVPLLKEFWILDMLGETGNLRYAQYADSWYSRRHERPAGSFHMISTRLRYLPGAFSAGFSTMVSGGEYLIPGWFAALSSEYSSDAWRVRMRGTLATRYFRDADGDTLKEPMGIAADLRYRPKKGFQYGADYRIAAFSLFPEGYRMVDQGSITVGWRFDEIRLSLESDWNRVFLPVLPDADSMPYRRVKCVAHWDRFYYHLGLIGIWEPVDEMEIDAEFTVPLGKAWIVDVSIGMYGSVDRFLLKSHIECLLKLGQNKLIASILTEDIMRHRYDSTQAIADMSVNIRWIRQIN